MKETKTKTRVVRAGVRNALILIAVMFGFAGLLTAAEKIAPDFDNLAPQWKLNGAKVLEEGGEKYFHIVDAGGGMASVASSEMPLHDATQIKVTLKYRTDVSTSALHTGAWYLFGFVNNFKVVKNEGVFFELKKDWTVQEKIINIPEGASTFYSQLRMQLGTPKGQDTGKYFDAKDICIELLGGKNITPAEYLKAQPKPVFREGHTLSPLTRFGWVLDFATRVELAENWGYCLEWGGYADAKAVERALTNSGDIGAKCMALAAKDPAKYKLSVICARDLPENDSVPPETWARDADGKLLSGQAKSYDGTAWTTGMGVIFSPETPDSVWKEAGRLRADPLRLIREKCRIAIVINGGEYGLGVIGHMIKIWKLDPSILKAKGDRAWFDYISERKGRAETIIADTVRKAVPDRLLYIYYNTGTPLRNRWGGWLEWCFKFEDMKSASDLPGTEIYYKSGNSGWTWTDNTGDALTQALNARGLEIAHGQPLSYNFLCGGWTRNKDGKDINLLSDINLYIGFLKCFYTSGMVGGNAGYYTYPPGGFGAPFPADQPPHWLRQLVALSQTHALFSHLEDYLRKGDLLPGPNMHRWTKDQPAYEFPTGDKAVRVLARKIKGQMQWLITAWAADGVDRPVAVDIPELGNVHLQARACGSVYKAVIKNGKPVLVQVDEKAENIR